MSAAPVATLPAVRALLASAIDYAGLFPPADLDMGAALDHYLAYRTGEDAWALGRMVVPVARFAELEAALSRHPPPWSRISLSALVGIGTAEDVDAIERFNLEHVPNGARVEAVEVKAGSTGVVHAVLAAIPRRLHRYVEVPVQDGLEETLAVIGAAGAFVKVRTGGTTPDAFPPALKLASFLEAAARHRVPFKATAGLHHPVRGGYPLTYAPDAPCGLMYGYLNLFIASAILWGGGLLGQALDALREEDPAAFWINGDAIMWRDQRFPTRTLVEVRRSFAHSFGSCSFTEPVGELTLRSTK